MAVDEIKAAKAVHAFLRAIGRDPDGDPDLRDTPARVADAWAKELVDGYDVDIAGLLMSESASVPSASPGLVGVRGLSVATMCPHHLLPARGTAAVLYVPGELITGLGTLARLVDAFAHRLTFQEAIASAVAGALVEHLGARGAACKLSLSHSCLASRGERQDAAIVDTIAFAGSFDRAGPDRDLVLATLSEAP
jgi:GTP cyclohydrolase I